MAWVDTDPWVDADSWGEHDADDPPTVDAGADQADIEPWTTVTLTATSSETSVTWTQLTGPAVTLAPTGLSATFTAPPDLAGAILTFRATATNSAGTATDDVQVTVLPATDALMTTGGLVPVRLRRGADLP